MIKLTYGVFKALNDAKYAKRIKPGVISAVADDPKQAYMYAYYVVGGRFPEGEAAIGSKHDLALDYAIRVLNHRPFPAGEAAIAKVPRWAAHYASEVLNLDRDEAEEWGEKYLKEHKDD